MNLICLIIIIIFNFLKCYTAQLLEKIIYVYNIEIIIHKKYANTRLYNVQISCRIKYKTQRVKVRIELKMPHICLIVAIRSILLIVVKKNKYRTQHLFSKN